jgi:hypothetical protein
MILPSKELLSEVLNKCGVTARKIKDSDIKHRGCHLGKSTNLVYTYEDKNDSCGESTLAEINIYELIHMNLKQWAKLNNCFDIIDWSGEPDEIFTMANKIYRTRKGQ